MSLGSIEAHFSEFPTKTLSAIKMTCPNSIDINNSINYLLALSVVMVLTKFEKARIIGARALQISMGAPVIIDVPQSVIDPVDIAIMEFDSGLVPITIKPAK